VIAPIAMKMAMEIRRGIKKTTPKQIAYGIGQDQFAIGKTWFKWNFK
jgi:hypothetical protein